MARRAEEDAHETPGDFYWSKSYAHRAPSPSHDVARTAEQHREAL